MPSRRPFFVGFEQGWRHNRDFAAFAQRGYLTTLVRALRWGLTYRAVKPVRRRRIVR